MMKLWPRGKESVGSAVQIAAALLFVLGFVPVNARAQSTNPFSYGAYRFYSLGSARVMAMGGAFAATVDDATAVHFNPAGAAIAKWRFDFSGTNNRVDDQAGPAQSNSYYSYSERSEVYSFIQYAAAARLGRLVFGLGMGTPYDYRYSDPARNASLEMKSYSAMLGLRVTDSFGIGVSAQQESLKQHLYRLGEGDVEGSGNATSFSAGALYRTKRGGLGAVYFQEHSVAMTTKQTIPGAIVSNWLLDVKVPSATCVGAFLNLHEKFLVAVDVNRIDVPQNVVDPSSSLQYSWNILLASGTQQIVHGGFEWTLISEQHMNLIFRGGGYMETARIEGGDSRLHRTYGLQVQFGPAVLTVSFDQATQFNNTSQGFSLVLGEI